MHQLGRVTLGVLVAFGALAPAMASAGAATVQGHYRDGGDCDWSGDCGDDSYHNDYGNRGDNSRGRDRGSFSPGPFDDSPVTIIICPPGTTHCGTDGGRQEGGGEESQPQG